MPKHFLEIKPAIPPATRQKIEAVLRSEGYHVHGGGTVMDLSSSDVSFSKEDEGKA